MHGECERAREWASFELDGELSAFERVLLRAHLRSCEPCRDFHADVSGFTTTLREAPHERFAGVQLSRPRRRVRLRLAPAVAAMAVVAVGLGSIRASSHLGSFESREAAPSPVAAVDSIAQTGVNLHTLRTLKRLNIPSTPRASTRWGGGPVVQDN
jgi:hypothetical protein